MEIAYSYEPSHRSGFIPYGSMSPSEAAKFLQAENVSSRSFSETLMAMYPHRDLVERIMRFFMMNGYDSTERSLAKRIGNWMRDKNVPTNRDDLFKIAFALQLNEGHLDYLLGLGTDYCIQYRDGKELVLAWFLRNGYGYQEALEFFASLPPYKPLEMTTRGMHTHVTRELKIELANVRTLDELYAYYLFNKRYFGKQHLKSYYYFEQYLKQLVSPPSLAPIQESEYSIERVMQEYLSMKVPPSRTRRGFSHVQWLIKQGWPNTTSIKDVRNHVVDVPRKLLILLYIITENCGVFDDNQIAFKKRLTAEERIDDHWWSLNAILIDCGMAELDPRNAFDWLVLFSIAADPDEPISSRMEQVLDELFHTQSEES